MSSTIPAPGRRKKTAREALLLLHRVTGFYLVVFLVVAGVTGSFLAFAEAIDEALNPELTHVVPPAGGAPMLDPFVLRERVAAQLPGGRLDTVVFPHDPTRAVGIRVGRTREYFVDPYDGRIIGSRTGELGDGVRRNLVSFVFKLHHSLALGHVGTLLCGVAALLWTIDCFVGAYLTFPPVSPGAPRPGVASRLRRWAPSWWVKTGSLFSCVFTFHRAAGLWLWSVLLIFAWSAVGFNLHEVFDPVMKTLTNYEGMKFAPEAPEPVPRPRLDFRAAHEAAKRLTGERAASLGFSVVREGSLEYRASTGAYAYRFHGSRDIDPTWPGTTLYLSGNDGRFITLNLRTGERAGDTAANWLFALHMGRTGSLTYRIFVVALGLAVPALALSGIWIWWRKRRARGSRNPGGVPPAQGRSA